MKSPHFPFNTGFMMQQAITSKLQSVNRHKVYEV